MSNEIFFTSDTHFNHVKCVELFRNHRFNNLEEMNETIIQNWNNVVSKGDKVYHLGDFALGRPSDARQILDRLNGQIFLIRGNHDQVAEHKLCRDKFVWIKDVHKLKIGEQKIYLCHYAWRVWNCSHHGSWHLYGHSHGSLPDLDSSLSFDVGVDCWNYTPVSMDQIRLRMCAKTWKPVDHHIGLD